MSRYASSYRTWLWIALAITAGIPGLVLRFSDASAGPELTALISGIGILGAAFLLSWAVEVAQLDISASLAIAIFALVALLPEFAIEGVLAWDAGGAWHAGARPEDIPEVTRVAANVTGANRLLVGMGWSLVVLVFWLKHRTSLVMERGLSLELTILTVASLLTFLLFFMEQVTLYLSGLLIALYLFYLWASSRTKSEAPELMGPSAVIGGLSRVRRLPLLSLMLVYPAIVILAAAEPFVDGLVEAGANAGINEFILIQWLAPLVSESPELLVAVLLTLRANPVAGLGTLISSGLSHLTLLIGCMPFIFSVSLGRASAFPLDSQQSVEFLLTASLSVFAIVLLARMRIAWEGAVVLLALFLAHLFWPDADARKIFALIYLILAAVILAVDRGRVEEMYRRARTVFSVGSRT